MEKRIIFPALMFALAAASFLFGGWQYLSARSTQAGAQARMAYMITSIEKSSITNAKKQEIYASIMQGLPPVPGVFGIDFSGSFASTDAGDSCTSDGRRAVCRALEAERIDTTIVTAVCGACSPH